MHRARAMAKRVCLVCEEQCIPAAQKRSKYCATCRDYAYSYFNTVTNNKRLEGRAKSRPQIALTQLEWMKWKHSAEKKCVYCGIQEEDLPLVQMESQCKMPVKRLGIDRLDSEADYVPENMVPCCFVCNQIKSDRFTPDEMKIIGASVAQIWIERQK